MAYMKVYIAVPLFSQGKRDYHKKIDAILRSCLGNISA